MRARLLLGAVAAALAVSFVPQPASATGAESCHHWPWLCNLVEDVTSSIACIRGVTC